MSTSTLHYRLPGAGRVVSARIAPPELIPLIDGFYRTYRCAAPASGDRAEAALCVDRAGGGYRVRVPAGDWEAETAEEAVLYYEYELTDALLVDARRYVQLHGAAICGDNRCLWLVGPSGAGKSTLTLGLYTRGWRPLADDALLVDPTRGAAAPFDRSIRVHTSGLEALDLDPAAVPGGRQVGPYLWLEPGPESRESEPRRPDAILVLDPCGDDRLERLGESEALRELLIARLSDAPRRDFECVARLAAEVPVHRLSFPGFRHALERLTAL
ncbi:MAG: hypothetical protein GWN99_09705 [Gemmatimonadetes bacterium]|uniref:Hpr(Ser) kinase/phosphatase n=1 Tax=Candidatus Kutchimonas denitrificans TaxID=3056748 RepID=A0AAE4Z7J8_9BACT|nr:hypothetical protein [Gemmatimonadota bacterium]NIR74142.1 hypothetical protein [Candidatus Kutchimonas denitrificans]NIS01324.1 hypothetical protein [Gemmatimonadota bacterium]NIT67055.1 hypothetical protein [Gemmatimonadota bacterium]NIU51715.1 hypothetical protein [Gemmatimonadota bacterium]